MHSDARMKACLLEIDGMREDIQKPRIECVRGVKRRIFVRDDGPMQARRNDAARTMRNLPVRDQKVTRFDIELRFGFDLLALEGLSGNYPAAAPFGCDELISLVIDELSGPLDPAKKVAERKACPALRRHP